jgi:nitrite reductase/ring-hydroxylating ferredoxin subunit
MFVISNISSTNTVTIATTGDSLTNPSLSPLAQGESVTLYSVNVSGGAYWVVA